MVIYSFLRINVRCTQYLGLRLNVRCTQYLGLRLSEQGTVMPFREMIPFKNLFLNQENHVDHLKLTCLLVSLYTYVCF